MNKIISIILAAGAALSFSISANAATDAPLLTENHGDSSHYPVAIFSISTR